MVRGWRAGRALVCGMVGVVLTWGPARAQPSQAEQLRVRLVEVLDGPACLGLMVSGLPRWTTILHARNCAVAMRAALATLILVPEPPVNPPPAGTTAVIEWRIPLDQAPAPPLATGRIE